MKRRRGYNPKRQIASADVLSKVERDRLAKASYGGNPEHKLRPGDYGLTPPSNPRPSKTLCDGKGPFSKANAVAALLEGISRGMVSEQRRGDWPQNVWSVFEGEVFEAELENKEQGIYHGYPVPLDDEFRSVVLKEWNARDEANDRN